VVNSSILRRARIGQMLDDTVQAIMRGQRRNNKSCPVLIPVRGSNFHTKKGGDESFEFIGRLMEYFREDEMEFFDPNWLLKILDLLMPVPKITQDKKYENQTEVDWMKNFRRYARQNDIVLTDEIEETYLRDKRAGVKLGPKKWFSAYLQPEEIKVKLHHAHPYRVKGGVISHEQSLSALMGPP
jgi:hypothetical protein